MIEHRCTTVTVRMVLKACESAGVDTNELLRLAGIERETAEHPEGEVSFTQMRDLWKTAYRLSEDPLLGLKTAQHVEIGDYKCLDYLTLHAATVKDSIKNICRYTSLINTWIYWDIDEKEDEISIRMSSHAGVMAPHSYEFVFAIITKRLRQITSENWSPKRIGFPFPSPTDPRVHKEYFKSAIQYGSPTGELVISRKNWNEPLSTSDQQLLSVLDKYARVLLEQRAIPDEFITQIRKEIVCELHGSDALRNNVAKNLNISTRTLQRRLDEHGVTFSEIVEEVREELAKSKLQTSDLSLAEIGFLLGYSEQSSFNRAFKRWTGRTPREYRQDTL